MYGAQLIEALRRAYEHVGTAAPTPSKLEFFGVGGDRMRAAGCDTVIDAKDLSVVGITETAPAGVSYQDWMQNELDETERALAGPSS